MHANVELIDLWSIAARRLDPTNEDELCRRLVAVERASWARVHTTQRSTRLVDLLREASAAVGLDVEEAVLTEAATHHLDAVGTRSPGAAVFVGDRPVDDIRGASQAGLRAVWRRNDHVPAAPVRADAVIDALPDLLRLLERWGHAA